MIILLYIVLRRERDRGREGEREIERRERGGGGGEGEREGRGPTGAITLSGKSPELEAGSGSSPWSCTGLNCPRMIGRKIPSSRCGSRRASPPLPGTVCVYVSVYIPVCVCECVPVCVCMCICECARVRRGRSYWLTS